MRVPTSSWVWNVWYFESGFFATAQSCARVSLEYVRVACARARVREGVRRAVVRVASSDAVSPLCTAGRQPRSYMRVHRRGSTIVGQQ